MQEAEEAEQWIQREILSRHHFSTRVYLPGSDHPLPGVFTAAQTRMYRIDFRVFDKRHLWVGVYRKTVMNKV